MPQKHRVRNWNAYNKALQQRGDLFLDFDEDFLKKHWTFVGKRRPGGVVHFSDAVIEMMVSIKNLLRLPLRQARGKKVASITADRAYYRASCYHVAHALSAQAIIPPIRPAKPQKRTPLMKL